MNSILQWWINSFYQKGIIAKNSNVAIEYRKDITDYPSGKYYYNPSNKYPEYPFGDEIAGEENPVYDMVRNTLYSMGYDRDNFGKKEWNPLGDIIKKKPEDIG